jgi:hypothetical protein
VYHLDSLQPYAEPLIEGFPRFYDQRRYGPVHGDGELVEKALLSQKNGPGRRPVCKEPDRCNPTADRLYLSEQVTKQLYLNVAEVHTSWRSAQTNSHLDRMVEADANLPGQPWSGETSLGARIDQRQNLGRSRLTFESHRNCGSQRCRLTESHRGGVSRVLDVGENPGGIGCQLAEADSFRFPKGIWRPKHSRIGDVPHMERNDDLVKAVSRLDYLAILHCDPLTWSLVQELHCTHRFQMPDQWSLTHRVTTIQLEPPFPSSHGIKTNWYVVSGGGSFNRRAVGSLFHPQDPGYGDNPRETATGRRPGTRRRHFVDAQSRSPWRAAPGAVQTGLPRHARHYPGTRRSRGLAPRGDSLIYLRELRLQQPDFVYRHNQYAQVVSDHLAQNLVDLPRVGLAAK